MGHGIRVQLEQLSKRFGAVQAVDCVDLELRPGEIHALLGENGAGKSTLMSLLCGLYRPDSGRILLDGQPVRFRSPRQAIAAGIGMVHQHFMLIPPLTVWENVLLGAPALGRLLRPRRAAARVQDEADRLGLQVDARARVSGLSVGQQQRVEILRVLMQGARVMILDEPTAVLSPGESEALFRSLARLGREGRTIVLISHKLEEVQRNAHRATVLRRGRLVQRFDEPAATSARKLAAAMVGEAVQLSVERPPAVAGEVRLALRGLRVRSDRGTEALRGVDLELRAGELLGLAGVAGNGQVELFEAVAGLRPTCGGELQLMGRPAHGLSPRQRLELGLRYIPEDRNHTGTAPSLTVHENLCLRSYRDGGRWLRLEQLRPHSAEQMEQLRIAASGPEQCARMLSGGNLQKVVLARELDPERARLVLALHPTRGLDARATVQVRRLLLAARERGAALLLWSEDLDEVLALSDRVAIICGGRLVREVAPGELDRAEVGRLMTGGTLAGRAPQVAQDSPAARDGGAP